MHFYIQFNIHKLKISKGLIVINYPILKAINSPEKIKKATYSQLNMLSEDVRKYLIDVVSKNGGHLASNLGAVEITLALLRCFNPPDDKIVFDVGHQCYTYKLLTDRAKQFPSLRQENGISGFPKTAESKYDAFISGHASTSLSVALGLKMALTLDNKNDYVVAVIGDGSLTGGMAYEAFNNIGKTKENIIVILNDNEMAISKNEGAVAKYLLKIRNKSEYFKVKKATEKIVTSVPVVGEDLRKILFDTKKFVKQIFYPCTFFEDLGFRYYGPVDGHNIEAMCELINEAKKHGIPAIIHVNTKKGKGYEPAELNPGKFHGISKFDANTGELLSPAKISFSEIFGKWLLNKARENNKICGVTAAMEHGTCMQYFAREFKSKGRYYDVGIAEEHAVTFCSAMSKGGIIPVFAVYSTFLQRSYDQLIHDCSIEKSHVIFAVDRAGVVGDDGETHQGLFDVAFLSSIPNFYIYSPSNYNELKFMLDYAVDNLTSPVAVRYPRGAEDEEISNYLPTGKTFDIIGDKGDTLLITYGKLFAEAFKAQKDSDIPFCIMKINRISPFDENFVEAAAKYKRIFFFEEGIETGSFSEKFAARLLTYGFVGKVKIYAVNDFVPQGKTENMLEHLNLCKAAMVKAIAEQ